MAGNKIGVGRRSTLVRHKHHVEGSCAFEQFGRQMCGIARYRAEVELTRLRLDQRNQLLDVTHRERRMHYDDKRRRRREHHWCEIARRVITDLRINADVDRHRA